jgi:hypothetical protein
MSTYSRNFGFRSFANIVRDGRARVPATGNAFKIGAPVVATDDGLAAAGAGAATTGAGVVVFEHIQVKGTDPALAGTAEFDYVPVGAYAQRVHGVGTKVWFRNTASKTLYDGRVIAAGGLLANSVDLGTLAVGDALTPDGAGKFKVANGTTDGNWLIVTSVNATTGVVEAEFTF